jgi:hypothetical protein
MPTFFQTSIGPVEVRNNRLRMTEWSWSPRFCWHP